MDDDRRPAARQGGATGDAPPRRRRRSRRPRRAGDGGEQHRSETRAPGPELGRKPAFDVTKPATAPLTAAEKAELAQHLAFIAKYRRDLRVRTNDAEDLLITGAREPTDRGVCMHLLGKIDRALVSATLARVPDPARRTRILAGVARFSRDAAILIQYLECLGESAGRDEAAVTLSAALPELDYAAVSPAQMRRVLELVATLLPDARRPMLVLGLLRSPTFRAAFDQVSDGLPQSLAILFAPMRAVYVAAFAREREGRGPDRAQLGRGVRLLLAGPADELARLPEQTRERLVAAALDLDELEGFTASSAAALLGTLPKDGRGFSQLATRYARRLLAAGRDADARALLEELQRHHPDFRLPARWLAAIAAPKVGRVALLDARPPAEPLVPRRGLWLEHQKPVWIVTGAADDGPRLAEAAAVHAGLALPGLLPLLTSGVDAGTPFFAVAMHGEPLPGALGHLRHETGRVPDCLRSAVELVAALALAGIVLPDADLRRFTLDRECRLQLASLVGCRRPEPGALGAESLASARALGEVVLRAAAGRARSGLRAVLAAESLQAMARAAALIGG